MPPKKVKHGGRRENAGREIRSGDFTKDKTAEEKRKSHRELMAKSRGQVKVPEARARSDSGDAVESVSAGPGRPALDLEQGAMKGNVLAQYKLERQRESRKKQKISSIRRAAVASRRDRGGGNLDKLLGEGPDEQHWDVNLNEDIGGENNTNEELFMEQKASSRSTYFEKLGKEGA